MPASTDVEHQLCPEEAPFFSRQFPLQTGLTRYSIDLRRRTRDRRNEWYKQKKNNNKQLFCVISQSVENVHTYEANSSVEKNKTSDCEMKSPTHRILYYFYYYLLAS